jgi:two-component system, OmpR family, phosphate regulon response regulator PhoB
MRILVIDDDPGVRMLCRIAFRVDGDEVLLASSWREGSEIMADGAVDAAIIDVMLPSVSGFDIVRQLRDDERTSDLPIVLLSVRVGILDRVQGFQAGADEYLTKPFSPSELRERVSELCRFDPRARAALRDERCRELASA